MTQYPKTKYETNDDKNDNPLDSRGILKDGKSVRVSMMMLDSLPPVQRAIALSQMQLHDGFGRAAGSQPGYVFSDAIDSQRRAEDRDFAKAQLSAAWKGGLAVGDRIQVGDHEMFVVGHNADNGKPLLREVADTQEAASAIKAAYQDAETALTNAWKTDGRKVTQRDPSGRLKSTFEREDPDEDDQDKEFKLGGPLSDGQDVKDAAYSEYEQNLQNAWRR